MSKHRYSSDIDIPNLDAMSLRELEAYSAEASKQAAASASPRSDWLNMAARYARMKAKAMDLRAKGDINLASRYERECDNIYDQIPKRMKW